MGSASARRRLGSSPLWITRVGLGTWAIGGNTAEGYGRQDDGDSVAAIHRAIDGGVNWIDTAPIYGLGHSEEVVGRALVGIAVERRPFLFTKCGLIPDPTAPSARPRRLLTPASMRLELEGSLRRLGVERIDLYQVHRPDEAGTPVEDSWGEMGRFIEEGKVAHAGVSNFTVAELDRYEAIRHIDTLQPPFSAVHREAADQVNWCLRHGSGVLAYGPMGAGLLTDAFSVERAAGLPTDDWRRTDPEFSGERLVRNLALRDMLAGIGRRRGVPTAVVAIAWATAWPGITAAIAGARRPSQVEGWLPALGFTLTQEDLHEIAGTLKASGAGAGPVRPMDP